MGNLLSSCIKINIETVDSIDIKNDIENDMKNDYNSPEIKEHRFHAPKKTRSISPIK